MGSPVRPPDAPDMQEGLDAATADLAARMSGKSAPPPATPATETPPTETPPAAPPETPPEPPTPPTPAVAPEPPSPGAPETPPAPPAEPAPPPEVQDPAAQRFLEMYGGDRDKALAAALGYNNRLAALAKAHPEMFADGAPGDPNAPPPDTPELFVEPAVEPPVPAEDFVPDQNELTTQVNQWVDQDPQCRNLMHTFATNEQTIGEKKAERDRINADIDYKNRLAKDEAFSPDDVRKADLTAEVQALRFEAGNLGHEIRGLEDDNRRMDEDFRTRRRQAWDGISEQMEQRYAEEALEQEAQQTETLEFNRSQPAWIAAVNRAIQTHKIPPDQEKYFRSDAKTEALAALNDPEFNIEDYDAFLAPIAKRTVERIDASHRVKAAEYGAQAHARAETPAPASPPGTPPPPTEGEPDLDSIMETTQKILHDRMRG